MITDTVVPVEKKKRINSKKKGSNFEGSIAKLLSAELTPMQFRRSQSSGAILGGINSRFSKRFSDDAMRLFIGDIVPTNETDVIRDENWRFRFTLECKFYRSPDNIDHLFNNTRLRGWIAQAITDAQKVNRDPLLIFKFNFTDIFACTVWKDQMILPVSLTKQLRLRFDDGLEIIVFLLKEALIDSPWWRVYGETLSLPSLPAE